MRDLIGRVEVVDSDAASALRVIDHFDRLVEERASSMAVVRAAAALAGCPAGLHDAARGLTGRFTAAGQPLPGEPPATLTRTAVPGAAGSWIWLERNGIGGSLDSLIVERAARAVQTLLAQSAQPAHANVRIVCDAEADASDRRDAALRLGLTGAVRVIATLDRLPCRDGVSIGSCWVQVMAGRPEFPGGVRAGVADAAEPTGVARAAERAMVALRLTGAVGRPGAVVHFEQLGALAAVAERFTASEAAQVEDVCRIIASCESRPWTVDTLQAVVDSSSLRGAAGALHLHHSSLQDRLVWLTEQLGYDPASPSGRQRAGLAVALWRIAMFDSTVGGRGPTSR